MYTSECDSERASEREAIANAIEIKMPMSGIHIIVRSGYSETMGQGEVIELGGTLHLVTAKIIKKGGIIDLSGKLQDAR
jgi:hypothetical protein